MDNLNKTTSGDVDADHNDGVTPENERVLSDDTRITQSLGNIFSSKTRQKNDDYSALVSALAQLREQYIQSTDEFTNNAADLARLEHDNTLLSDANLILVDEVASDTQLYYKNQRDVTSDLCELRKEKESLTSQVRLLKTNVAAKQAENEALDQEIDQIEQMKACPKSMEDSEYLQDLLLREQAEIADLFLHLEPRTTGKEMSTEITHTVVEKKTS